MKIIHPKGFTLVELMVTIAILSILASMAVPSFIAQINQNKVTTEARALVNYLTEGRAEAVLKQKNYELLLKTLTPEQQQSGQADSTAGWGPGHNVQWETKSVDSIKYNPMGRLMAMQDICFVLSSVEDSSYKAVVIASVAGSVVYHRSATSCTNLK